MKLKKLALIGISLFVIIACVLAAGCTSSTTNNLSSTQEATTAVSTPAELSTYGHIDYSNMDNWMIYTSNPQFAVDTIFLYPTAAPEDMSTFYTKIDDAGARATAQTAYIEDGSEFANLTNMYAPYYRQVSPSVLTTISKEEFQAYAGELPYQDVCDALDYYFEHQNNGRPFILASYSQGSLVMEYVLADYMKKHPEYYKNMVAAYVIGIMITDEYLASYPHLKFAKGEDDTGVIISWTVETPGATQTDTFVYSGNMNVINPLNWKTDDTYAGISENKGSLITNEDGKFVHVAGITDAQIDPIRHVLITTTLESPYKEEGTLGWELFGDHSLHLQESAMFYENIRDNAMKRITEFFS